MEKKLTEIKSSTDLTLIQNAMVDLNSGIGSYFIKNEKNLISFSPIENAGWSLAITASYKEFTKRVNSVISFSSIILIIGLGLAIWLIYLIVHGVTKPLTYLTEVSDKITNGDFSTRSNLKIDNEVGHLSNSFNVMVDKLDNYNKNLEAEVLERTRELLVMNEELEATNETLDSNAREMEMLNEELQATNETLDQNAKEMEAMNEELKVSNESIETVNEELMQTVDELDVSNKQLSATRDALWSEMELAQKLQTVLLPEDPKIDGFDISAFMTTTSSVGGDYYDVINIEGRDWFLIGDVSGHGVTSGLIMMMVQTSLHVALFQNPNISPVELLDVINKTIHSNIFKLGGSRYMTLTVFACLDEGRFTFAGAHLPLILHREKTDEIEMIETPGAWIGLIDDIQGFNEEREFSMEKGDSLLLYTDGITEATNEKGISFSQEKLAKLFKENVKLDAKGICESIKESSGNLKFDDDVSIMVLKKV
ncbi:HAMP domain-containing protein [Thiospirochaeta perfilievii]|uniref:HAMP domain-containing protein n=1 Tax=Thiospirochaeta perfilievii TaxID=252967 RepID=A0A5C1QBF0_9SPIO|nr:SpoIIE family protein phosphatase [Thiospirochaeta perfilievii]QEN04708.1 HAMP domain-containing protein [Thiospirochaeta perfilievii]